MKYENLEHTADVMIRAYGATVQECFENAAYGMMDQILDASSVELKVEETFSVDGETKEDLLYNFLSELLFIFDAKQMALSEFRVTLKDGSLECNARGERFDREKHSPKQEIKAVTYHMMQVNESEPSITVLFDV
ncbi:MAG: archease [Methanomassiliicoccus sp.]|nr:archease [Methanomassiliicoccus sp.]